jgi:hypothetical protein
MTTIELITKDDLEKFKNDLLTEMRKLLHQDGASLKKWLKSGDVKDILKISTTSLQNLRINGTLRSTKVGGILYYKMEDINALLESGFVD